jgi:Transglutaminase-like superfamily
VTSFLRRWQTLSTREQWLALEALSCLFLARVILAMFPFATALQIMKQRTAGRTVCAGISSNAEEIKRAVSRAARHAPFKAVCLQQAFAAFFMLHRRNLPATVHLGVRRQEGAALAAHAWSMSGDIPITGTELADQFEPIAAFTA